ncbi:MAG: hypothetical protein RIA63_00370 [Cyclobacteriaceae bacterium]
MGTASATLADNWSLFNNTAGLAKVITPSTSFAYAINPNLPGANRAAANIILPFKIGTFSSGIFRFGDELYSEQIISTGYANQFGIASLGFNLNFIQQRAEGFETRSTLGLNFGGITEITPLISIGAYILNINQPKISGSEEERLPVKLVTGVQFKPDETLLLLIEVEKDLNYDPTFKGALEYQFHKKLDFRTGFNLKPNAVSGGVGYKSGRLIIDYSIRYNPEVLTTFQMSTSYKLARKNREE